MGKILWNIIFEDFLIQDFGDDVHVIDYADDAMVLIQGGSGVTSRTSAEGSEVVE